MNLLDRTHSGIFYTGHGQDTSPQDTGMNLPDRTETGHFRTGHKQKSFGQTQTDDFETEPMQGTSTQDTGRTLLHST
jgi:hypothetical protein